MMQPIFDGGPRINMPVTRRGEGSYSAARMSGMVNHYLFMTFESDASEMEVVGVENPGQDPTALLTPILVERAIRAGIDVAEQECHKRYMPKYVEYCNSDTFTEAEINYQRLAREIILQYHEDLQSLS